MSNEIERLGSALADRYRIERELGSGGMATVYLAEDLKHHRKVAVKVLRPDLAAVLGPERFIREIEVAAQLHHPHILPLYDSGEAGGFLYYVMPYEEGQSLREKLEKEGELPITEAVRILRDVVDALAHAHKHGVVHRDIKPDNVMLSERHALVTDFGVAKAVSEATGREQLTTAGVALGTPVYMAPEQATADPHIDHRADIYALGALAYELLTGRPPFTGTTPQMILAAHVTDAPEPVTKHRQTVPPALERLVMRCLEKKPADRWQRTEELLPQLEALTTPSAGITPTDTAPVGVVHAPRRGALVSAGAILGAVTVAVFGWWLFTGQDGAVAGTGERIPIAVLVFENRTAAEDDEYFSEGIADDISTQLSKVGGFAVKAHASARRLSREQMSYGEIANDLGVDYLVHGNWRRSGDSVRITARLIAPETEEQLWAESYNREMTASNMFGVRSDVAAQVATALNVAVAPEEQVQLAAAPTTSTEAYTAYQLGRFFWNKRTEAGLLQAIEHFSQAIAQDSTFALAYSGLADANNLLPSYGSVRPHDAFPRARAAASKALAIDSTLAEGHTSLAFIKFTYDWDWVGAAAAFERAIALNPSYAIAHFWYGGYLVAVGRVEEGQREVMLALELDPLSLIISADLGDLLTVAGRYDEAIARHRGTIALDSTFPEAHRLLAMAYLAVGRVEDAMAAARRVNDLPLLAEAVAASGNRDTGRELLARVLDQQQERPIDLTRVARIYLALGDTVQALDWLDRAVEERSTFVAWFGLRRPVWNGIRDHPRFRAILRRVGLD